MTWTGCGGAAGGGAGGAAAEAAALLAVPEAPFEASCAAAAAEEGGSPSAAGAAAAFLRPRVRLGGSAAASAEEAEEDFARHRTENEGDGDDTTGPKGSSCDEPSRRAEGAARRCGTRSAVCRAVRARSERIPSCEGKVGVR